MKGYRVTFIKPKVAELRSFELRKPKDNEVMVKVKYTLISAGTEKAYLSGANNTAQKFPTVPGYSSVGTVVEIGSAVTKFRPGDRVFVEYAGHASYNWKKESGVVKIPDDVSFIDAVFTRVASFPLLAIRRSRLEIGESCVVVGLGMLGLFGVQIARACGATPLIAIGNREIRQEKAALFGAEYVFSPSEPNLVEKIYEITEKTNSVKGANVVLETSGSMAGLQLALRYSSKHARILINGCNRVSDEPIDLYKYVHIKGLNIIGCHDKTRLAYNSVLGNFTAKRDYITLLNLMRDGRIDPGDILSEIISPTQISEIYNQLLTDRQFPLGVVFDWDQV